MKRGMGRRAHVDNHVCTQLATFAAPWFAVSGLCSRHAKRGSVLNFASLYANWPILGTSHPCYMQQLAMRLVRSAKKIYARVEALFIAKRRMPSVHCTSIFDNGVQNGTTCFL